MKIKFAPVDELVKMGQEGREKLGQYIFDVQKAIGDHNEFHPDWDSSLSDALEELGWNEDEFIEFVFFRGQFE